MCDIVAAPEGRAFGRNLLNKPIVVRHAYGDFWTGTVRVPGLLPESPGLRLFAPQIYKKHRDLVRRRLTLGVFATCDACLSWVLTS